MSRQSAGSIVGGAIGAVIGFYAGGNVALGWSIGSSIGGYVTAPDTNVQGPRLNDSTIPGVGYGTPIPSVFGTISVHGTRVWSTGLVERSTEEDAGGKGGPDNTVTTYRYTASWAELLCEGPAYVRRLWADGKLIYHVGIDLLDPLDPPSGGLISPFAQTLYQSQQIGNFLTIYSGSETQLPDPTIETKEGVGNVPAYRGWCYVVFNDLDVTDYGRIPFIEAEIVSADSAIASVLVSENRNPGVNFGQHTPRFEAMGFYSINDGIAKTYDLVNHKSYLIDINSNIVDLYGDSISRYPDEPGVGHYKGVPLYSNNTSQPLSGTYSLVPTEHISNTQAGPDLSANIPDSAGYVIGISVSADQSAVFCLTGTGTSFFGAIANAWYLVDEEGVIDQGLIDPSLSLGYTSVGFGSRAWNYSRFLATAMEADRKHIWSVYGFNQGQIYLLTIGDDNVLRREQIGTLGEFTATYPSIIVDTGFAWVSSGTYLGVFNRNDRLSSATADLADTVANICSNSGLSASDYDTTDLAGKSISGYVRSRVMSGRNAIEPLQQSYWFDAVEAGGKINFIQRGGASIKTLTDDEIGSPDDHSLLTIIRGSDQEIPKRVTTNYKTLVDFSVGSQYSSRISGVQSDGETVVDLPIVMDDDSAARIAEVLLMNAWQEREKFLFTCLDTTLNPADVVTVDVDGLQYNLRLTKVEVGGIVGPVVCEAVLDDASIYNPVSVGSIPASSDQTILIKGPSRLEVIDSSLLLSTDSDDGVYLAAAGYYDGWPGCVVLKSMDGASWSQWASITNQSVIGSTTTALASASHHVTDSVNSVLVSIFSGALYSVSDAQWLNGANAALIGDEVVLYRDATQINSTTWELSHLIRGARGTEWAIDSHVVGDRFIKLDASSMVRAPLSSDAIGITQYCKSVTFGQSIEQGIDSDFVYAGNGYKCFAPARLQASDNGDGTFDLSWIRRVRKNGEWRDYVDVPLIEDAKTYRVEVWRSGSQLSTVDVSTESVTVTAQTSDIIRVAQISAVVGAGHYSEITIP